MSPFSDIRRLIAPFMRGLPFILMCCILVIIVVYRMVSYQVPLFESEAKIRIDSHGDGFSDNNLYNDLDIFSETNEVLSEVELIKSAVIIDRALTKLPSMVDYYRVGEIRTSEMYTESPFKVKIDSLTFDHYDELITLDIQSGFTYRLTFLNGNSEYGKIGEVTAGIEIILKDASLFKETELVDKYQFRVNTFNGMRTNFVESNLLIKEIDKDINVVRVYFEGEHPQKVADFTNAICEAYLEDHVLIRTKAATITSDFLDVQLNELARKLELAEEELESFRLQHDVLDVRVEIETGLKKLSELEIQKANLEIKVMTLDTLIARLNVDSESFLEAAPAFEAHGGLVYLEFVKNLRLLKSDRGELLKQYTNESFEVLNNQEKIDAIETFLLESMINHRAEARTEINTLQDRFKAIDRSYDDMPTKERRIVELERTFIQYQDAYNFLKKKSIESDLAKVAEINFHRIIQTAEVSEQPASPKASFILAIALFLTLVFTTVLCYLIEFFKGVVKGVYDFQAMSLKGVIQKKGTKNRISNIAYLGAQISKQTKKGQIAGIVPCFEEKGVTDMVMELSQYLKKEDRSVAVLVHESQNYSNIDLLIKSEAISTFTTEELMAVSINKRIKQFAGIDLESFDYVFIITGGAVIEPHVQVLAPFLDSVVLVSEFGVTKKKHLNASMEIMKCNKHSIEGTTGILLGAPEFLNYDGTFIGRKFSPNSNHSVLKRVFGFYRNYMNRWWV